MPEQIEQITRAKVSLVNEFPFFGSLALRYPSREMEACPTMATNGREIIYNRAWTESLTRAECAGVVAHEVCHIAFLHHLRLGDRDPFLFNVACDFAINPILIECGFTLPTGALLDKKYAGMTAEHIYDLLLDDIKSGKIKVVFVNGESMGNGHTIKQQSWGAVDQTPLSEAGRRAEEAETRVRVLQAAQTAKSRGKMPQAFSGLIDDFLSSKVNWRERIRTFIGGNKPDDYSYRRPNKKHMILSSVYLPTIEYVGAGVVVIGVDSSGSVSDREMAQFLGEIKALHSEMRPDSTHVIWVDTMIHNVAHYSAHDEFDDKKRYACGGTALRPAFEWVEEHGIIPDSFVFLTDLEIFEGDLKGLSPAYPVLWVSTGRGDAPFGEVIRITTE